MLEASLPAPTPHVRIRDALLLADAGVGVSEIARMLKLEPRTAYNIVTRKSKVAQRVHDALAGRLGGGKPLPKHLEELLQQDAQQQEAQRQQRNAQNQQRPPTPAAGWKLPPSIRDILAQQEPGRGKKRRRR